MNTKKHVTLIAVGLIMGCALGAASAANSDDLPDGRWLIERHIEAMGGRDAILAQNNAVMRGEFAMPAAGVTGSMIVASRSGGERVVVIELPGMGEIRSGYGPDGAWSVDPFMGPRLLEGDELVAQAERMEPGAILRDSEFVSAATTVGQAEFAGQACYRVELSWRSGRSSHDCYAVDSGLLLAMESVESSPMGEVESLTILGDYQEIHGLMVPTETRVRTMGQEQILTIEEISLEPADDALFELPPPIRTLLADR